MVKKVVSVLLCAVLACCCALPALAAGDLYLVAEPAGAPILAAPQEDAAVLTVARYNTVLACDTPQDGYLKTVYGGYIGWVLSESLVRYGVPAAGSISVSRLPDKTVYYEDDGFSADGLEIVDETGASVTGYTLTVPDLYSLGRKTVTVTWRGLTASFEIEVIRQPIDRIEITKLPDRTTFVEDGGEPDLSGMEVTAFYTDGRAPKAVTDWTLRGFDPLTVGEQTVQINYKYDDVNAPLTLTVAEKQLVGVQITSPALKQTYYEDDLLPATAGLELSAFYDNGKSEPVRPESVEFTQPVTVGEENFILLTYQGMTASYAVPVLALEEAGLEVRPPRQTEFVAGTQITPELLEGMTVYLVYNSGAKTDVAEYSMDPIDTAVYGEQTVNVYYKSYSASFTVRIVSDGLPGDINKDGKVNSADARMALRYAARLIALTPEQLSLGDVVRDGKVNSADGRKLLRVAAHLEEL